MYVFISFISNPLFALNIFDAISKALSPEMSEDIQWLWVGDGPLREELEADAPENVQFTGYLNGQDLAEIYSVSDLFVFPSRTETFGNVVLEALASGTPVIGANSGGVKNVIQSNITGKLCEPGNVDEFTTMIVELLSHDSLRWQMSMEGRKYAMSQRWDLILDRLLSSYQEVIQKEVSEKYA